MKFFFATSNLGKLREFREKLKNTKIIVEHLEIPYPEIQSNSLDEIAKFGARFLANKTKKTVVVEDSGLFISKLNGFPGPYSKYIYQTLGYKGIIKLLENEICRDAHFESVISYCCPKEESIEFKGICKGKIAKKPRGSGGFGFDPIFIPNGSKITFAEMDIKQKNMYSHRGKSVESFVKFLKLKMV